MAEHVVGPARIEAAPGSRDQARADSTTATELIVASVLRYGVALSLALIAVGVALMFATGSTGYAGSLDPAVLLGPGGPGTIAWPHSLAAVASGLLAGRPYALIVCGLLLLIATPVIRVAISVVTFAVERDYQYALITLVVLGVLVLSFLLGAVEAGG
jgi:uncharacterized membrane protein